MVQLPKWIGKGGLGVAAWAVVLGLLLFRPLPVSAQSAAEGIISGQVIESETRAGLPGALVQLEVLEDGTWNSAASATTTASGSYRFAGLEPGQYRLAVTRLGYVSANVEIDLRSATSSRLSVGLEIDPITLSPLAVLGGRPETFGRLRPNDQGAAAAMIDRARQQRYLVSDTRELTYTEVVAAVTLAEADLFRALQRVPGVSTRDDYTATMWTRGATWDQTRIYFDGLPLYNPTHAGWLFAAVNPDAVASATFHPGYRSARWGEGSAGILDLRSRTGRSGDEFGGNAEVSVAGARLSVDGEVPEVGLNWMVAGRRSYVDLVTAAWESLAGTDDLYIPYDFTDVVGRADLELGAGWRLASSAFFEYDHLRGDIPGLLEGNRGRWGNRAGRISLDGPLGPLRANVTTGRTDFTTLIFEREDAISSPEVTLPALENGIEHRSVSVEIEPASGQGSWSVGAQLSRDSVSYDGPFSLIGALVLGTSADSLTNAPFRYGSALSHSAVWGEKRWEVGSVLDVITGLRAEFGDSVANGGTLRFAPRIAARLEPRPGTGLSLGWSRSYQYTQDVSPAAGPIGPQLHLSAIWVLASSSRFFPAIRTDLATVGFEQAWSDGFSLIANGYLRQARGLKIPNPAPGAVVLGRDPDAEAENEARGMEISLRRLSGQWTGSVGYSWGTSTMRSTPEQTRTEFEFPSSAEIVHSVDATLLYQVNDKFRVGGALTYGSGVPFTRLILGGDEVNPGIPILEAPNAERTPSYASLDLMGEYEHAFTDWTLGGYLQLRNAFNRNNAVTYSGSTNCSTDGSPLASFDELCAGRAGLVDRFEPGLPLLPLIGVRISF